jgi:hypothetical protein
MLYCNEASFTTVERSVRGETKMNQAPFQIPAGLFTMSAEDIVEFLASRERFPGGPSAGLRMLSFYLSYACKRLGPSQQRRLERAKKLLAQRVDRLLKEQQRQAA